MYDMIKILKEEIAALETAAGDIRGELDQLPAGKLHVRRRGRHYEYAVTVDGRSVYKNKEDSALPLLARREYLENLLKQISFLLPYYRSFLSFLETKGPDSVFFGMHPGKQRLIEPLYLTPRARVFCASRVFSNQPLAPEDNQHHLKTLRGEYVRSKSELIIANTLYHCDIPYVYEPRLNLAGYGIAYPDFLFVSPLTGRRVYWEHLGMLDDAEYRARNSEKIYAYLNNGYVQGVNLILTYEDSTHPLRYEHIENILRELTGVDLHKKP